MRLDVPASIDHQHVRRRKFPQHWPDRAVRRLGPQRRACKRRAAPTLEMMMRGKKWLLSVAICSVGNLRWQLVGGIPVQQRLSHWPGKRKAAENVSWFARGGTRERSALQWYWATSRPSIERPARGSSLCCTPIHQWDRLFAVFIQDRDVQSGSAVQSVRQGRWLHDLQLFFFNSL